MRYEDVELHNVGDIRHDPDHEGFTITRLPEAVLPGVSDNARAMATHGSGVEVRGVLPEGGTACVTLELLDTNVVPPVATVYHGCFSGQAVAVRPEPTEIRIKQPERIEVMRRVAQEQQHPFSPDLVRVCLPPIHPVRVTRIEGDLTYPPAEATPEKTLLCYGSSITHGAHALSPQGTYAAQCATRLGYDLINLGSGGSARMDAAVAEHIAARDDWDVASLEMGINVRDWTPERFHETVERFVATIAQARPDQHLFCIDLLTYFGDYQTPLDAATAFRGIVEQIVSKQASGRVHYIDGRTLLTDARGLQTDLVHPNDNGMQEIGRRLADIITEALDAG